MKLIVCLLAASACFAATTNVPAGADLQAAINNAQPGDTLVLAANATYVGNFTLPVKSGASYITITSSDLASLPAAGVRVNPSYVAHMPKLVAPASGDLYAPVVSSTYGAHHFAFVGIEFAPSPGQQIWHVVELGDTHETSPSQFAHDFIFDRCYIHADPAADAKTGLAFNGINMTAENSYISGFKSAPANGGWDTQAISGASGPGPFRIVNNYLEASGENIMWGGAMGAIPGIVPSNFEIQGNYFTKPLSWWPNSPTYGGVPYVVKNLIEFKVGKNITIEGNIFENCWFGAQSGFAAVFTVRTEGGAASWFVVQNIVFRDNIVRHASAVFNFLGHDNLSGETGSASNFQAYNNLFYDISCATYGGSSCPVAQVLDGFNSISITHNTGLDANGITAFYGNSQSLGFVMRDNILPGVGNGIFTDGSAWAGITFSEWAPDAIFTNNAVIGGNPGGSPPYYPTGNFFPANLDAVGFANYGARDYELLPSSQYATMATDGTQLGADVEKIADMTAGVISGAPASAFAPIFVHAGGSPYQDIFGQSWSADYGFSGGQAYAFDPSTIVFGTGDPALYTTCRYGASSYTFAVPNGNYTVTLKFAENIHSNIGDRVFNVLINGATVLSHFDILADAGSMFVADDKTFPVTVTGGQINITFDDSVLNNQAPVIFGIEIVKQ